MPSPLTCSGRTHPSGPPDAAAPQGLYAVSGASVVRAAERGTILWLVLRGKVEVESREGHFILGPCDWIALEGDFTPSAKTSHGALLIGIQSWAIPARDGPDGNEPPATLFPGRGRMARSARVRALKIWRAHVDPDVARIPVTDREDIASFLSSLQADVFDRIARCPGHSDQRKRQVLHRMQRARLILEGQADAGLKISELARRINFSPWYFSKVFHALYDIAPLQFAAWTRLEHAYRLLATTRLPVTEVSASCGFDNPCSFARAFRARYGTSASEHRLRHARDGHSGRSASRATAIAGR